MASRVETLDMPSVSASEPDVLRKEAPDAGHVRKYNVSSVSSHGFPSAAQPSVEFGYPQGNTQFLNLSAFSLRAWYVRILHTMWFVLTSTC